MTHVTEVQLPIRIETEDGDGYHGEGHVRVYTGRKLLAEFVATIGREQGADGGWYPTVSFSKVTHS